MKKLLIACFGITFLLVSVKADAQYNDASTDMVIQSSGSEIARLRNAGLLQLQSGVFLKTIADACDSSLLGVLCYNSTDKTAEFCNGSDWTLVGAAVPAEGNFFVMSSITSTGGFGGVAAANATCESDLTNKNWKNNPAGYPTGFTTRAFLCDSSGCNNLIADTEYTFARAGSTSNGGDTFTTDGTGAGPGATGKWNVATKFGTSNEDIWTGRTAGSSTVWGVTASGNTCSDWSAGTSMFTGVEGRLSITTAGRWANLSANCSQDGYFVCIVDAD